MRMRIRRAPEPTPGSVIPASVPVWAIFKMGKTQPAEPVYRPVIAWSPAGVALILPFRMRDKDGRLVPAADGPGYAGLTHIEPTTVGENA